MTYYHITKYALGNGGKFTTVASDAAPNGNGHVYLKMPTKLFGSTFMIGRDVFTSEVEAKAAILAARDKKIASLEKQIARLRKIL